MAAKKKAAPGVPVPDPARSFVAKAGLDNDATGRRFEPGDTVTLADFPGQVIDAWLAQGVIEEVNHGG